MGHARTSPTRSLSWSEQNSYLFRFRKGNRWNKRNGRKKHLHQNRHHLLNKCRGGGSSMENILWLDVEKHAAWHKLFKNSPPEDIVAKLRYAANTIERMMSLKGYTPQELEKEVSRVKIPKKIVVMEGERIHKYAEVLF